MNRNEKMKALEEIRNAINNLESQKSLTTEELLKYYVEREAKFINMLKNLLRYTPSQPIKILFSGHIGSGKSSELFKLKKDLDDDFLMIYYSIKEYMSLGGLNTSALLETIREQLKKISETNKIKIDKKILEDLEKWNRKKRQIGYRDKKHTSVAGLGGDFKIAKAKGELYTEKGTKIEEIREEESNINELLSPLNQLIAAIQEDQKKDIIIIIDDIDKLDLADAEELFLRHSRSLTIPNCKIIYTIPISLLYSVHYHQFESFYHSTHLLPISKVRKKNGSPNDDGIKKIKDILALRLSPHLFESDILEKIIMASGGVIRDAIKILQRCCLICVTEGKATIDEDVARESITAVKNEFLRQIPKELYRKLIEVKNCPTKIPDIDQELQKLLYCLGTLEYNNDDTWYDVHPLAIELAEVKEEEYKMELNEK